MEYEKKKKDFQKVEIYIPLNRRTDKIVRSLREYVIKAFGGLTSSKVNLPTPFSGAWYDKKYDEIFDEDAIIFIILFDPEEIPNAQSRLEMIARQLIKVGEREIWQIFQNASVHRFIKLVP